jgi:hypothetical protein
MKKLLFFLLFFPFLAIAQTYSGPESVDCDTITGNYYISNTGSKKILLRTPAGVLQDFVSGLTSGPHGLEVVSDRIYACDGNKVKGFLLSDGSAVFSVTTNATFLNGITHDTAGMLYATDFSGKKVYKINPSNAAWNVFVPQTTSTPNGILFDPGQNRLVCVTWGTSAKILGISLADSTVSTLKNTTLSNIDGIGRDGSGRWYLASWGANAIHRIASDFSGTPELVLSGMNHPADIYYNLKTDTLAIPNAGNNTVVFAGFAPVSAAPEVERLSALTVFPNPASDILTLELPEDWAETGSTFQFVASTGQQLAAPVLRQDGRFRSFSVKNLPPGAYQIHATSGKLIVNVPFVHY